MESKTGFFSNKETLIKDNEILYIPSMYNSHWSIEMNKIFSKYFFTYKLLEKEQSYLKYHKLTYKYYYKFFDNIRNNKDIKYIFLQNLFEDVDWRLFKLTNKRIYGFVHSFSNLSIDTSEKSLREEFIIKECSGIFVASEYMKNIMIEKGYPKEKIYVCGFPFSYIEDKFEKEEIIIFNHRLIKDKGADKFLKLIPKILERYKNLSIHICIPKNGNSTNILREYNKINHKRVIVQIDNGINYYNSLKKAKYGLSLSEFDTFGSAYSYALLHNIYYLVPNKFAFSEIANEKLIYNDEKELFFKLDNIINNYKDEEIQKFKYDFLEKYNEKKVVNKIKNIIKNGK